MTWGYILLLAATLVLVLWYITVKYRFECFILSRKMITIPNKADKIAQNDAYISFDEDTLELHRSFLFIDITFIIPSFVSQVIMFLKPHLANSCFKSHGFSQAIHLSLPKKCPLKCSCYFQPSRNRTVVDCSGLNITVIKNTMPDFDNLEIS
jgi:hypothetical protein